MTNTIHNKRQGFTLMETVLVVAVLAILVGLTLPAVARYSQKRDIQLEQNRQLEIRNAIKAHIMDKNIPLTESGWVTTLAQGYTNLSQADLSKDIWGNNRVLRVHQDTTTRSIQGNSVPITYISLHSEGPDGAATAVSGTAVSGGAFVSGTNVAWWDDAASSQRTALFSSLTAGGDDIMTKVNDYTERLEAYELTVQRIDRIMDALAVYAQNEYTKEVERCHDLRQTSDPTGDDYCDTAGALERRIYFPRSVATTSAEISPFTHYKDSSLVVDNTAVVATRRTQMQNLMRTLGLPIEYCCSAIEMATDNRPMPFYYFSNPRQRNGNSSCETRPGPNDIKLSPRVVTKNQETPGSSADKPATCG